jgi:Na+/H+ antiporter NhaD/arsenite permease-like protein
VRGLVVGVFVLTYAGMAAGRLPRLRLDRTGFALLGATVLLAAVPELTPRLAHAVDVPTLVVLGALLLLSAQLEACHAYDHAADRLARLPLSPEALLAVVALVVGALSALLTNDVVAFALTPLLCRGLAARGLDPRPYLLAVAGASNAGSAATTLGNPQNVLIGQVGHLSLGAFARVCAVPALLSVGVVVGTLLVAFRGRLVMPPSHQMVTSAHLPPLERAGLAKAALAGAGVVAALVTPFPDALGMLAATAPLLVSRHRASRDMLARVDWPLLLLFVGLFVVTDALAWTGLPAQALAWLAERGLAPDQLGVLAGLSLAGSNTIGNVPLVTLLLSSWAAPPEHALVALALLSTLAGNLLLVGSVANLIVVERAGQAGVRIGFWDHARTGIPITLGSMGVSLAWLAWVAAR